MRAHWAAIFSPIAAICASFLCAIFKSCDKIAQPDWWLYWWFSKIECSHHVKAAMCTPMEGFSAKPCLSLSRSLRRLAAMSVKNRRNGTTRRMLLSHVGCSRIRLLTDSLPKHSMNFQNHQQSSSNQNQILSKYNQQSTNSKWTNMKSTIGISFA